ncbi:MAG: hypothetical protein CM1200mP18_02540 [Gammaproteobacteria bacterium]|nr:MAG: hypothetical protein CM1200mP18_02540 [Gammaproteobacteria bacterium]
MIRLLALSTESRLEPTRKFERQGAETWVVTTKGFKDTLEIARTERRELYNIKTLKPASLVLGRHILEIDERILFDGTVVKSVDEDDLEALLATLIEENPPAVAVCFLHSYVDDSHERKVADAITKVLPACFVCSSGQVFLYCANMSVFLQLFLTRILARGCRITWIRCCRNLTREVLRAPFS